MSENARAVIDRYWRAMNDHDLEGVLECFEPDYRSEQPVNPDRSFQGRETVRERWSTIFESVPDFRAELVRTAAGEDAVWSEWRWTGTRKDGTRLDVRGVTITGVRDGRIGWGRFYLEEVGSGGGGMRVERDA
jgi:ketosteroid isomerase-like protein